MSNPKRKLSESQFEALCVAFVDGCQLELVSASDWRDRDDGFHPRTLQSLLRHGLIETTPDSDPNFDPNCTICRITDSGRAALNVLYTRKPRSLRTALRIAIQCHAPWLDKSDIILEPKKIPQPIDDDDRVADYSNAVGAVCSDGDDIIWSVVAQMVSDAGWPIHADGGHLNVVAFWPLGDDG